MYKELQPLLDLIEKNEKSYDIDKIKSAFTYAAQLHEGQFRLSGEPYICHPVSVAVIVAELGLDTDSICAALLHDTVEDCADKCRCACKRSEGDSWSKGSQCDY